MKFSLAILGLTATMSTAFQVSKKATQTSMLQSSKASSTTDPLVSNNQQPLYDPLGLYPSDAPERQQGLLRAIEPDLTVMKPVIDPMNLYSSQNVVDEDAVMSESLPFVTRPLLLDGSLAGDVGFDPLGFAKSKDQLLELRDSELRHSRIAMLAAVGWPLSELWDKQMAGMVGLKPLLGVGDRVPSLLNGGLLKVPPAYWVMVLGLASFWELTKQSENVFDPLGFASRFGKESMELAEIKNGRLAMLAVTGFAIQEFVTKIGVVNQTPFFFHPFTTLL